MRTMIKAPWALFREISNLPFLKIHLWGGKEAEEIYRYFVSKHPRFPLISRKSIGVALLQLPDNPKDYFTGREKQVVRTNKNKAQKLGYSFAQIDPLEHIDEIIGINVSAPSRQGKVMDDSYTNRDKLAGFLAGKTMYGVFSKDHKLVAYVYPILVGQIVLLSRILGSAEHLNNGVMYLLVSELVGLFAQEQKYLSVPRWVMYDTMLGAKSGLRYFKERLGFRAYRIKWIWDEIH
jgi:hypothetical protein